MDNYLNVFVSIDDNFLLGHKVCIYSLYETQELPIKLWLVDLTLSREAKEDLLKFYKLLNISYQCIEIPNKIKEVFDTINKNFSKRIKQEKLSIEAFVRLFITHLIPEDVKKILWLDADTIVVKSLTSFWEKDFEGNLISGVDPSAIYYDWAPISERWKALNQIRNNIFVLGTGVIKYNLEEIRKNNFSINFLKEFILNKDISIFDKGPVNTLTFLLYRGKAQQMDIIYNFEAPLEKKRFKIWKPFFNNPKEYYSRFNDARIIHYLSPLKPWDIPKKEILNIPIAKPWIDMKEGMINFLTKGESINEHL